MCYKLMQISNLQNSNQESVVLVNREGQVNILHLLKFARNPISCCCT